MIWSDYEGDDERLAERDFWRQVGIRLFVVLALGAILAPLYGCATTEPEVRVCFMHMMGRTQQGLSVVAQHCMSKEAFEETQK